MRSPLLLALALCSGPALGDSILQPLTDIPHGSLVTALGAERGETLFASKITPEGRRVEFFYNATAISPSNPFGCSWTVVVTWRPTGSVTKTSPAQIFGEGDAGVCIPAP